MTVPVPSPAPRCECGHPDSLHVNEDGVCWADDNGSECRCMGFRAEPREEVNEPGHDPSAVIDASGNAAPNPDPTSVSTDTPGSLTSSAAGSSVPDTSGDDPLTIMGRSWDEIESRARWYASTTGPDEVSDTVQLARAVLNLLAERRATVADSAGGVSERERRLLQGAAGETPPETATDTSQGRETTPEGELKNEAPTRAYSTSRSLTSEAEAPSATTGDSGAVPAPASGLPAVREPDEATIRAWIEQAAADGPLPWGDRKGKNVPLAALDRLVADREKFQSAVETILLNAEAWHGPPDDSGHVKALAVIAKWCRNALADTACLSLPERRAQSAEAEVAVLTARLTEAERALTAANLTAGIVFPQAPPGPKALYGQATVDALVAERDRAGEALERLCADLETNTEWGCPDYAVEALRARAALDAAQPRGPA